MRLTLKNFFFAAAVALLSVYGAIGADWLHWENAGAYLGFGLVAFVLAVALPPSP